MDTVPGKPAKPVSRSLSDLLGDVRLSGRTWTYGDFAGQAGCAVAPGDAVFVHAVIHGEVRLACTGGAMAELGPGDIAMVLSGEAHALRTTAGAQAQPHEGLRHDRDCDIPPATAFGDGPRVTEPLRVRLSPDLPPAFTTAFTQTLAHLPWLTPLVERATLREMRHLSPPDREWHGTSGNMLLYVQHDTLRVVSLAYAVHTRAEGLQEAIHDITHKFDSMLHEYAHAGHDPINSCLEMRVTDVDHAEAVGIPGAVAALLSPGLPMGDSVHVIWIDLVTTPGTPMAWEFYAEYEAWLWRRFPGRLRPEWSKAWAVSTEGPWTDPTVLAWVRETLRPAAATWDALDKAGVYGSPLLDRLRT